MTPQWKHLNLLSGNPECDTG